MSKRLQKKFEKRKRKLIHEMFDIVLDINGLGDRKQKITGNLPTAFFNFSGHVGWVEVLVYKNGWSSSANVDVMCISHTKQIGELTDAVKRLQAVKTETPGAATPGESR